MNLPVIGSVVRLYENYLYSSVIRVCCGRKWSFLVIGANDGVTADPLRPILLSCPDASGVFFEPVYEAWQSLRENVVGQHIFFCSAVTPTDVLDEVELVVGAKTGRSTLVHGVLDASMDEVLERRRVPAVSLRSAIEAAHFPDVVQIDTEGLDGDLVRSLLLLAERKSYYLPRVLRYESDFLSRPEKRVLRRALRRSGYWVFPLLRDDLCVRK